MANLQVKDAAAATKYLKSSGAGSDGDPHIVEHLDTNSAAMLAALEAIQTAVELIDNMIAGSEAQVDVVSSGLPTGAATEATLAAIQTATEAIQTAAETLDDAIAGSEMQVDVVSSALPTGAATEATLAAIQTAVELIDNMISGSEAQVDVVSSALPTGAATEATLAAIQTAAELIDNAIAGSEMQVDIVADGAGLATESTLGDIKTAVELIDNMISGSEAQVDVVSSALPSGAATEATLADIQTAVELIDNMISGSEAQVDVVASLPAGTNTIGTVGLAPQTSGGLSIHRSIDLDESEEEVKSSAGQVFGWYLYNLADDKRYIKFYNAPAASVTVGTTTPVLTIALEADQGANVSFPNGIEFDTGICVAATTGVADNDTGAPGANEVIANVLYI